MTDYIRRLMIAMILAIFIGILFIGSTTSFASAKVEEDLLNSLIWPTVGDITDTFGTRDGKHYGMDIAAPEGTPIKSIDDGVVTSSYYSDTYGNVVFVEHPTGLETVYAHMHERDVSEGDFVTQGQVIGTVGNTGRSSGNHLHFEVHLGNWNIDKTNAIDPMLVLYEEQSMVVKDDIEVKELEYQEVLSMRYSVVDTIEEVNEEDVLDEILIEETQIESDYVYSVIDGDTLWGIANKYLVSVQDLIEWNELDSTLLTIGQPLTIHSFDENMYVVKKGDTLSKIVSESGMTLKEVKTTNELMSDMIYPGMVLRVEK
ncbi:M23 family metallopeptidase [Bacillus sp. FJAT-45350]|uniref:M23 family metallopeptidase n=1 Tax=Bacillus sp. FJAT-45350 TaxID=2011014 RepID=UPI000BB85C50|nr:M23 family metallopeptidase [Bacillus sp. FJAT-45350]